jgi:N,N'-diacetyllegionaminate synthase
MMNSSGSGQRKIPKTPTQILKFSRDTATNGMNSQSEHVYVIAEAGVNHNGDVQTALKLIDAAARSGADAVKFQTWESAGLNVSQHTPLTEYQSDALGPDVAGQVEMLDALGLEFKAFAELQSHCADRGVDFISTPDDEASVDLLAGLDVPYIKTASAEINNIPFLQMIAKRKIPMIVSTGMSTLDEVERAINAIRSTGLDEITVLHCTSEYPSPVEDVNLRAMQTMAAKFDVRIGYSDHTRGTDVAIAAVALGATVIEKHFTLDRNQEGPDHEASLEPDELTAMIDSIRRTERFLGDGVKRVMDSEAKNRPLMRRSLVANGVLPAGHTITGNDVVAKRPGTGIAPDQLDDVIGKKTTSPIAEDSLLKWSDLE